MSMTECLVDWLGGLRGATGVLAGGLLLGLSAVSWGQTNSAGTADAARAIRLVSAEGRTAARVLDRLTVTVPKGTARIEVSDGSRAVYFSATPGEADVVSFVVGGVLGEHRARALGPGGETLAELAIDVDAKTMLWDAEDRFAPLFAMLERGLGSTRPGGWGIPFRGKTYQFFVPWILDHSHAAKGMQYFSPNTAGLVDLYRQVQRENGMVWSLVGVHRGPGYYDSAYRNAGYFDVKDGVQLVRQPVENHNEYCYVNSAYLAWKGGATEAWLKETLPSLQQALKYSITDEARWSQRFGLLKRGYTIDSWDFQIVDAYTVPFRLGTDMQIDPKRTKFGVFFGDNHGYALACEQVAEMLDHVGQPQDAGALRARAADIRTRLDQLTWNGRFFRHRVEEDDTVKRDVGVDESAQIAMSNAYALNRGIPFEQARAIIGTYQKLRTELPPGSPGEFYAIYPPFERGFGPHSAKWQYMNAGVHGHAAGELSLGAFRHGAEAYGVDILNRMHQLAKETGGTVKFAYTGAMEPEPPPQVFETVSLAAVANMDTSGRANADPVGWMGAEVGNDIAALPTGRQEFAGVPWDITAPGTNSGKAAVAVSSRVLPESVEVPLPTARTVGAVYLLHTVSEIGESKIAGGLTFQYVDGTSRTRFIVGDKHITGWWFPNLSTPDSGVAWRGPNQVSTDVGVCWAAVSNPEPGKAVKAIRFSASDEGGRYAVLALTLADRAPFHPPGRVSDGGPDRWSAATIMQAMVEGLVGAENAAGSTAFSSPVLSPRWTAGGTVRGKAIARYAASQGYLAHTFENDAASQVLRLTVTGSGGPAKLRVLLPDGMTTVRQCSIDGTPAECTVEHVGDSAYAVVQLRRSAPSDVVLSYAK